jgi:hypothetical protein
MNQPTTELEQVGLTDALDLAIRALEEKAEIFHPAAKMVASRGAEAVPEAHADARRYERLTAAVAMLRRHKLGMRPY